MLCSNQQMYVQVMPFLAARPPVIVDWLPWNHTFGGNSDFNMILANGGTLYIDEGKPVPALTLLRNVHSLKSAPFQPPTSVPPPSPIPVVYCRTSEARWR